CRLREVLPQITVSNSDKQTDSINHPKKIGDEAVRAKWPGDTVSGGVKARVAQTSPTDGHKKPITVRDVVEIRHPGKYVRIAPGPVHAVFRRVMHTRVVTDELPDCNVPAVSIHHVIQYSAVPGMIGYRKEISRPIVQRIRPCRRAMGEDNRG